MRKSYLSLMACGLAIVLSGCTVVKLGVQAPMAGNSLQIVNPQDPDSFGYNRLKDTMKVYPAVKANVIAVGYPEYMIEDFTVKSGKTIVLFNAKTRKAYGFKITMTQGAAAVPAVDYDPESSDCKELARQIFP